jgi:hypothetical protein
MTDGRHFKVDGPHEVTLKAHRRIDVDEFKDTLDRKKKGLLDEKGCYVFALRYGRGYRPLYVGRTGRSFRKEAFAPHHMLLLSDELSAKPGTLVLFFLIYVTTHGRVSVRSIEELETYLIRSAKLKNPHLLNTQTQDDPRAFVIEGIDTRGRKTAASRALMAALDLA